jgi:hypothetical protein
MKRKCDSLSRPLSVPECDFTLFDHSRIPFPLGHTSSTYFQGLGSSPKPVKLLKGLDMGELARSHSTTELLPHSLILQRLPRSLQLAAPHWLGPGRRVLIYSRFRQRTLGELRPGLARALDDCELLPGGC